MRGSSSTSPGPDLLQSVFEALRPLYPILKRAFSQEGLSTAEFLALLYVRYSGVPLGVGDDQEHPPRLAVLRSQFLDDFKGLGYRSTSTMLTKLENALYAERRSIPTHTK